MGVTGVCCSVDSTSVITFPTVLCQVKVKSAILLGEVEQRLSVRGRQVHGGASSVRSPRQTGATSTATSRPPAAAASSLLVCTVYCSYKQS